MLLISLKTSADLFNQFNSYLGLHCICVNTNIRTHLGSGILMLKNLIQCISQVRFLTSELNFRNVAYHVLLKIWTPIDQGWKDIVLHNNFTKYEENINQHTYKQLSVIRDTYYIPDQSIAFIVSGYNIKENKCLLY